MLVQRRASPEQSSIGGSGKGHSPVTKFPGAPSFERAHAAVFASVAVGWLKESLSDV